MNGLRVGMAAVLLAAAWGLSGCETDSRSDDHYQIRVTNNSSDPVNLLVDARLVSTVPPDDGDRSTVSDDEHQVSLQREDGSVLFAQTINLTDGTYVRYTVSPGGAVTASGGTWDD